MKTEDPLDAPLSLDEPGPVVGFELARLTRQAGLPQTPRSYNQVSRVILGAAYAGLASYFGTPELWQAYERWRLSDGDAHALDSQADECVICHRKHPTDPASSEPWRIFAIKGKPVAVCDRHFARPSASEQEKMSFYGRVLRTLEAKA
jgi:hypothetical protein